MSSYHSSHSFRTFWWLFELNSNQSQFVKTILLISSQKRRKITIYYIAIRSNERRQWKFQGVSIKHTTLKDNRNKCNAIGWNGEGRTRQPIPINVYLSLEKCYASFLHKWHNVNNSNSDYSWIIILLIAVRLTFLPWRRAQATKAFRTLRWICLLNISLIQCLRCEFLLLLKFIT